jgi:hypothetical protein
VEVLLRSSQRRAEPRSALTVQHPNAAGIDVHDGVPWVCVPPDRDPQPVRRFGTFTAELDAIADWLTHWGVDTVAMESTGVSWMPRFELLERRGCRTYWVDAQAVAPATGRPKTEIHDCPWIPRLHSSGLLEKAFRPADPVVVLRGSVRQRALLIADAAQHVPHIPKALQEMNLQLTWVVSAVVGKTGLAILQAILAGQRDPQELAKRRDERGRHTAAAIAQALVGTWREEPLLALRQAVELDEFDSSKIVGCDQAINA